MCKKNLLNFSWLELTSKLLKIIANADFHKNTDAAFWKCKSSENYHKNAITKSDINLNKIFKPTF